MKVLKYILAFFLFLGMGLGAWLYYPQYKINRMKSEAIEASSDQHKLTYLDYYRLSSDKDINHLALGDSIIHGYGASETENLVYKFSSQLGEQLNKSVHYNNEGINGITSTQLNQLVQDGTFDQKIKDADIITINVGGNDVLKTARHLDYSQAFNSFEELQSTFAGNLSAISSTIEKLNPEATIIFLELYNPLPLNDQFYTLADKLLPKWNLKIYEVAQQIPSSIVVQTTKVINGDNIQNIAPDGFHPNPNGYAAITEQMLKQFALEYRRQAV